MLPAQRAAEEGVKGAKPARPVSNQSDIKKRGTSAET
jgi:hypothetical protein